MIKIDQLGNITTSLYTKDTDTRISPLHVKDSTPYSQRITVRRICSDFDDFLNHAHKIADILKTGYPYELLTKARQSQANEQRKVVTPQHPQQPAMKMLHSWSTLTFT